MKRASGRQGVGSLTPALAFTAVMLGAPGAALACGCGPGPRELAIFFGIATALTWIPAAVVAGAFAIKGWTRAAFVVFPVVAGVTALTLGNLIVVSVSASGPGGPPSFTDPDWLTNSYAPALPILLGASAADAALATMVAGLIAGARWAWRRGKRCARLAPA